MHVGLNSMPQNLDGKLTDSQVLEYEYFNKVRRAEELGFDSVWQSEHHFTDYTLTPNPAQFLSWVAGQTERVKLGSMVTVLPWHDPVRVAEEFALLDELSGGRAILGIGRGLGRSEFDGFRLEMSESRTRFAEYAEAILTALETGWMEYDGELYKQPRVEIRPRPVKSWRNRVFASAISPQSIDLMARLGVGLLYNPQKPWDKVETDLNEYRSKFVEINGFEPPKPLIGILVCVHKDEAEAQRMREEYLQRYARSTVGHYQFDNVAFEKIEGYEYYGGLARNIERHGLHKFNGFLADLQVWGTPEQVTEQLIDLADRMNAGGLLVSLAMGGMPPAEAIASYELFANEVLPALKAHDVGGDIGVTYDVDVPAMTD